MMDDEVLYSDDVRRSSAGRSRSKPIRSPWRHLAPMLAMLLIAALCPFVPTATAAADEGGDPGPPSPVDEQATIEVIPGPFVPQTLHSKNNMLNNNGQVFGSVWNADLRTDMAAVYSDGTFTELPWTRNSVADFTDEGKLLIREGAISETGAVLVGDLDGSSTSLPALVTGGEVQRVFPWFGPSHDGQVIGKRSTDIVRWTGATPPQVVTTIATLFKINRNGKGIATKKDTRPVEYVMFDNGNTTPIQGIQGTNVSTIDFSDSGHFLYQSTVGQSWTTHLWKDGRDVVIPTTITTTIGGTSTTTNPAAAVNADGVVLYPSYESPVLRFANGRVQSVVDMIGGLPAGWSKIYGGSALNNRCDVLAYGTTTDVPPKTQSVIIHIPDCKGKDFTGAFFRTDMGNPNVNKGESTEVRLRVENTSGDDMTNVTLTDVRVEPDGADAGQATLTETIALDPTDLGTGMMTALGFADFSLTGVKAGRVKLVADVAGVLANGDPATGRIETTFTVRAEDLVINLTLDPPDYEANEDGSFDPVDITATVSFTNETDDEITNIRLRELKPTRIFSGQQLYVTYVEGINPDPIDPEVIVESLEAGATSQEFTATFHASELGSVDFLAHATGKIDNGEVVKGLETVKKVRWKAKTKKYIELKTRVYEPMEGKLLKAGSVAVIDGTVENLTTNFKVTLGALVPQIVGNHGLMSIAYDGPAPDPDLLMMAEDVELEPGELLHFQVKFQTLYSDPGESGPRGSGGTRAYATFEPWGEAVEIKDPNDTEPPEVVEIRTYDEAKSGNGANKGGDPDAQVQATADDLFRIISIDDSVEMPEFSALAFAGGITQGALDGIWNATVGTLLAIPGLIMQAPQLLKLPAAAWNAWMEIAKRSFDELTPEEKEDFFTGVVNQSINLLPASVRYSAESVEKLREKVDAVAKEFMDRTQKEWYTGDYVATARSYTSFFTEQIGSIVGPIAITKLAKTPAMAAKLGAAQAKINASAAALFAQAAELKYVDNVMPLLRAIPNGAEPTMAAITKLWGIMPEEVLEYQRICKIIGCLATVRSRLASSIEWITKKGAMLKPEVLKIKTVNELDVILGYRYDDLGSLVFRKPEFLKSVPAGAAKADITAAAENFAASKGFKRDSKEFLEAVKRLEDRTDEWNKWEKTYKQWDKRGWVDVSFNYEGNAIPEWRLDKNGNRIGNLTGREKGKYQGFRMREEPAGSQQYIMEMQSNNNGTFRRITGDIDPVDFTYTDGSPLTPADHARLIKLLQDSPILGAQHGYTSTFVGVVDAKTGQVTVNPGPALVKKQFKPDEAALQIAPEGPSRATRLNVEGSRWVDSYDYNMRWEGGFVDVPPGRGRGTPMVVDSDFKTLPVDAPAQIPLPVSHDPKLNTVGQAIVNVKNKYTDINKAVGGPVGLVMDTSGKLQKVLANGKIKPSDIHEQAFAEGPVRTITAAPTSVLCAPDGSPGTEGTCAVIGDGGNGGDGGGGRSVGVSHAARGAQSIALFAAGGSTSLDAGSTSILVSDIEGLAAGTNGFAAGQQIAIGVDTDRLELRSVASVNGGVIILGEPLEFDHEPDDVVLMVRDANGNPIDENGGFDPVSGPDGDNTGPTGPAVGPGKDTTSGDGPSGAPAGGAISPAALAGDRSPDRSGGAGDTPKRFAYTGTNAAAMLVLAVSMLLLGLVMFAGPGFVRRRTLADANGGGSDDNTGDGPSHRKEPRT